MAPPDFIFMLTRDDMTLADARRHVPHAIAAGVRRIGFKDVGLPADELRALAAEIRAGGAAVYLEMVGLGEAAEIAGARAAVALEVDVLMGGVRPDLVEPIIVGAPISYHPFPGEIVGHPSRLAGDIAAIAASARALASRPGVHGLDLLAYRSQADAAELIRAVCDAAAGKPVIVAGSIDCAARIAAVAEAGAAGFTVGTAAFDAVFPAAPGLTEQLAHIAGLASGATVTPRRAGSPAARR